MYLLAKLVKSRLKRRVTIIEAEKRLVKPLIL